MMSYFKDKIIRAENMVLSGRNKGYNIFKITTIVYKLTTDTLNYKIRV